MKKNLSRMWVFSQTSWEILQRVAASFAYLIVQDDKKKQWQI